LETSGEYVVVCGENMAVARLQLSVHSLQLVKPLRRYFLLGENTDDGEKGMLYDFYSAYFLLETSPQYHFGFCFSLLCSRFRFNVSSPVVVKDSPLSLHK
jgi:hypothetical protein